MYLQAGAKNFIPKITLTALGKGLRKETKKDFLSEVLFVLVREGGVEPPRPE